MFVVETGLKLLLYGEFGVGMLKISLINARNPNYKNIHAIVEISMRTIQLKLFNVALKHELLKSNKETFNKKLNYFYQYNSL